MVFIVGRKWQSLGYEMVIVGTKWQRCEMTEVRNGQVTKSFLFNLFFVILRLTFLPISIFMVFKCLNLSVSNKD